jgi:CRP-like cAMP-binding protein
MQLLTDSILKHVALTEEEISRIPAYFERVKIRRHQYLLRDGEICRHEFFILKGCCRMYESDALGKEIVLLFCVDGWCMTDLESMLH